MLALVGAVGAITFALNSKPVLACVYAFLGLAVLVDALLVNLRLKHNLYGDNSHELIEIAEYWIRRKK